MADKIEVMNLLQIRQFLEHELKSLSYGTIEIREKSDKKYIYTHYRDDGQLLTKYIGEYSDELNNQIISNNFVAKELKKQIRNISKQLRNLNYIEVGLTKEIEINIDYAKRNLVNTIYKQAILEGVATTLLNTKNILEDIKVSNMTPEDIMKIINLKHAWEFILNKSVITSPTNYALLCEVNKLVEEGFYYTAGRIRQLPVKIGGTSWMPSIPVESDIKDEITKIVNGSKPDVDKAIDLLLYITKSQIFVDGNKRTAVIFANHYLISHGCGLIVIPDNLVNMYKKMLIDFYEGKDYDKIFRFLKEKCYNNYEIESVN